MCDGGGGDPPTPPSTPSLLPWLAPAAGGAGGVGGGSGRGGNYCAVWAEFLAAAGGVGCARGYYEVEGGARNDGMEKGDLSPIYASSCKIARRRSLLPARWSFPDSRFRPKTASASLAWRSWTIWCVAVAAHTYCLICTFSITNGSLHAAYQHDQRDHGVSGS